MSKSSQFGTEPLGKLLRQQAIPASVGFLIMSIYGIVDTIFVGRWVGSLEIGAITVVLPITFLMASIGMAIGIGGASVISRALGEGNKEKAYLTFGNQVVLTILLAVIFVGGGFYFINEILSAFGGKGNILPPAREYFHVILYGIPFLAFAMMSNNVIRAEGYPKVAMMILIIPAITNIILDPIFIVVLDMGIEGAAWATTLSYIASGSFGAWFFLFGKSGMSMHPKYLRLRKQIVREIAAIGSVSLARQGTISLLAIVLNNSLYAYGGEMSLSVWGIINRVMMFANFPAIGITQGFVPIVGYNFGAKLEDRVTQIINLSIRSATAVALIVFTGLMIFTPQVVGIFTEEVELINQTVPALRIVFLATPLLAISLIGSAYFQAIGKALPALLLTLTKQGFFLIPLVLLLPISLELTGVWISFPIADVGAAAICYYFLKRSRRGVEKRAVENGELGKENTPLEMEQIDQ